MSARYLLLAALLPLSAYAQPDLTPDAARGVFEELAALSERDGGALWGTPLYGPTLVVDPATRRVIANRPGPGLVASGSVYGGILPDEVPAANTAVRWNDRHWTMLLWPLPEDEPARLRLGAHELWHRVQEDLGFPSTNPPNLHLGTRDGRVWLRLEWRALAAALQAEGEAQTEALSHALAFRAQRLTLFPDAEAEERALLMHEGLAEYTGVRLSGLDAAAQRAHAAEALSQAETAATFVRQFAYASGPAYGLLLDGLDPTWRTRAPGADLPRLAAEAAGLDLPPVAAGAEQAAARYDGATVRAEEDALAQARSARLADFRRRFVRGPRLRLGFRQMNVSFDPGRVEALDEIGSVYASMRITDAWGTLTVTGGALLAADWSHAVVPAPSSRAEHTWTGEGYTLELAPGWRLLPGERPQDLTVAQAE